MRKVVLEEPPANLALNDPKVTAARAALLGGWEGNWLAYNFAHDIALPGAKGPVLEFLMYPQAETAAGSTASTRIRSNTRSPRRSFRPDGVRLLYNPGDAPAPGS